MEGCFTQEDTLEEAAEMTQEAIGLMLEDMQTGPKPSDLASLHTEEKDFVVVIPFNPLAYKQKHDDRAIKKTLSLPSWLNDAAEAAHLNFSGVLQEALKAKLNIQ